MTSGQQRPLGVDGVDRPRCLNPDVLARLAAKGRSLIRALMPVSAHFHHGCAGDPGGDRRARLDLHGCVPLEPPSFSLYDMRMVSEEQIQKWADEAEAGYDVDELKRRGRGRPGRGAEPMQVVAVRLTGEELDALDAAAAKNDMSRSEAIRAALAHFAA